MTPEAARIVSEIGVDVVELLDLSDFIFKDQVELTFADFLHLVLSFRGTNGATVKDIVELRKFLVGELAQQEQAWSSQTRDTMPQILIQDVSACASPRSLAESSAPSQSANGAPCPNSARGNRGMRRKLGRRPRQNCDSTSDQTGRDQVGKGRLLQCPNNLRLKPQRLPPFPDRLWADEESDMGSSLDETGSAMAAARHLGVQEAKAKKLAMPKKIARSNVAQDAAVEGCGPRAAADPRMNSLLLVGEIPAYDPVIELDQLVGESLSENGI